MSESFVIAVDGPAASGKSTVGRAVADHFEAVFVSSGLMYRAFTWAVLEAGLDPADAGAVVVFLENTIFSLRHQDGSAIIVVNERDPGAATKSDAVNAAVSHVAKIPEVRNEMVALQRRCADIGSLVMEGRDIGSVVFPETPYKIYLDASEEVRAKRRLEEGADDAVAERDLIDSTRKVAPLKVADGAHVIDTSNLSLDEAIAATLLALTEQGLRPRTL